MQIRDMIESAQSGQAMANLGAAFGISEQEARAVSDAVLPDIAVAIERNTLSRGGLADVVKALGDGHHEAILEHPETWNDPRVVADGEAILAHILGSEHKSRVLAARAQRATGVAGGIIEALLPILAQMLMGALSRYMRGGLGDVLSRLPIPGGRPDNGNHETGGTMPGGRGGRGFELPRDELPPAGGFPMPPMPGNDGGSGPFSTGNSPGNGLPGPMPEPQQPSPSSGGFPLPRYEMPSSTQGGGDEWGANRGGGGGFPLPLPNREDRERDNPYGDLSDILKRRGESSAPSESGGSLWRIVRNLLGSVLGFGGSGFFGWILRFVVLRFGWPLLRRVIFGR